MENSDFANSGFEFVTEISLNAKGFIQFSKKYRSHNLIKNEDIIKDLEDLEKKLKKSGYKFQSPEVKIK